MNNDPSNSSIKTNEDISQRLEKIEKEINDIKRHLK